MSGAKMSGADFQISICPDISASGKLKFESLTLLLYSFWQIEI
jgi:hypothetical protein